MEENSFHYGVDNTEELRLYTDFIVPDPSATHRGGGHARGRVNW